MFESGILVQGFLRAALRYVLVQEREFLQKFRGKSRNLLEKGCFQVRRVTGSEFGLDLEK
jgi:hypothetical protein